MSPKALYNHFRRLHFDQIQTKYI